MIKLLKIEDSVEKLAQLDCGFLRLIFQLQAKTFKRSLLFAVALAQRAL